MRQRSRNSSEASAKARPGRPSRPSVEAHRPMHPRVHAFTATHLPLICGLAAALLLLTWVDPALAAESVPSGAQKALAPVTKMIATLVAIAIGLGIAICGAVIVWGGIEKTLAGANTDSEHRAQKRITN